MVRNNGKEDFGKYTRTKRSGGASYPWWMIITGVQV